MEKKTIKKSSAPVKKAAAPKKKITKKAEVIVLAPEATPYVEYHNDSKPKVSFWGKIKNFLGF